MGIRSIEKQLAAELCFEAVVEAVNNYLDSYSQKNDASILNGIWT